MDLNQFQQFVKDYYTKKGWLDLNIFIRIGFLSEETGEVARAIRALEIGRDRADEMVKSYDENIQEAEMSVKALMNSILVGNSQIRLNNQQAEAITDKVMQDWQSIAQQWNKLQQSGQMIEIDRERMLNEAKKILNDIVISEKKLTLEQQQQLLDVVMGLGGLATRMAATKGGQ